MRSILLSALLLCSHLLIAQDFDTAIEKQMFELVNKERTSRGIAALVWSDRLQQSARTHTVEIAKHKMLAHQFIGEPSVQARIAATGFHFSSSAENLASATYAQDLHPALMSSPGHKANILNPKYTAIGIGVLRSGDNYYATQNFALATEDFSGDKAEEKIAQTLNDARAARKLSRFKFEYSQRMRDAMCKQADREVVSARELFLDPGFYHVIALTTSNLSEVPPALDKVVDNPNTSNIVVGVCFRVTPKYPGGMYWLGFEY